jgi:hypothetical protein
MATSYPDAKDDLGDTPIPATQATVKTHPNQHQDANDAIDALQDFVGLKASTATIVQRFVDAAARDAAITAPVTGMVCTIASVPNALQVYNGSAWVSVSTTDVSGLTTTVDAHTTQLGKLGDRTITVSTSAASGGANGDIWFKV